jgi:hypothetical protein
MECEIIPGVHGAIAPVTTEKALSLCSPFTGETTHKS